MVENRVHTTMNRLTNFDLDHEGDQGLYEHIEEGLQLQVHRGNLKKILVGEVTLPYTYRALREAYLRLSENLYSAMIAIAELDALLDVLDLKCSQLARALEESERHAGDPRLEPLSEFFARKGVRTSHPLQPPQKEVPTYRLKLVK